MKVGGSKRELNFDVKILRPANVHEAIALAVQLENKFSELKLGN